MIKSYCKFSDNDKKAIRENIEKINTWVKDNIKDNYVRFDIEIPNDLYELKLFSSGEELYLRVGGGTYNFERSNNNDYDKRYWIGTNNAIPYAFEVIRNWKEIKGMILKQIEHETKLKYLLYNFEV